MQQFKLVITEKNPCEPNVCENGGTCTHNDKDETQCICKKGFRGEKCEGKFDKKLFEIQRYLNYSNVFFISAVCCRQI